MAATTFTRSIGINAPVREVFDFIGDPVRLFSTWPMSVSVSEVRISAEGVGTTYEWTGGSEWNVTLSGVMTREAHVPDEQIIERSTSGSVWDWRVRPEGDGSRLTVTCDHSARTIPGMDVGVMRMTARDLEEMLADIKERVERR